MEGRELGKGLRGEQKAEGSVFAEGRNRKWVSFEIIKRDFSRREWVSPLRKKRSQGGSAAGKENSHEKNTGVRSRNFWSGRLKTKKFYKKGKEEEEGRKP